MSAKEEMSKIAMVESGGNKLKYKNYLGIVTYDGNAKIFFGEVINSQAVITFRGLSVDQLMQSFADSVDAYFEFCKELGEEPEAPPEKTYSGNLNVRLGEELHRVAAQRAELHGVSLNTYIIDAVEKQLVYA